jgi:hypothetical protein
LAPGKGVIVLSNRGSEPNKAAATNDGFQLTLIFISVSADCAGGLLGPAGNQDKKFVAPPGEFIFLRVG